ncbi:(p)ppGpp synthetase [Pseudactinotalea terrae]|uniref:(p)ppGpp synthetase n=1 Tax=Pseudactinotalea terrae TaxID=1743262 RepID=UPI0012E24E01|nr:(p)ppGpp synthetase [Pseudactinotalea terrae]
MTDDGGPGEEPDGLGELVDAVYAKRRRAWDLAASTLGAWLTAQCAELLDGADVSRMTVAPHRIKDQRRTGDKLRSRLEPSSGRQPAQAVVEEVVRDVVGMKVLCKSTRDQRLLADRLGTVEIPSGIALQRMKDYVSEPKTSGYRAVHLEFAVTVPGHAPVVVELQIKTMLQDSWGELTHEDLYKPGAPIKTSPFHSAVGATMANLLAEVDRLADHLAFELESTVTPEGDEDLGGPDTAEPEPPARTITVRTTGPRYALAVDEEGVQGLIPAYAVRRLAGVSGYVRVHDFVRKGERLEARLVENEKGVYFIPLALGPAQ